MDNEQTYSIGELADLAEVTPRTIRYYTSEGLLPPPDVQNKYARYNNDHLERLRLIARLKSAYLPLHEIRARIEPLDASGVRALLNNPVTTVQIAETSSAADYIAAVIAGQQVAQPPQAESIAAPRMRAPAPAPAAQPASRTGFFRRLSTKQQADGATTPPSETWQRTVLAPGVELHIRELQEAEQQKRVRMLIDFARKIFGNT